MNAWVWVVIILWLLFMATYAWGMCRSAWRENPPMPRRRGDIPDLIGLDEGIGTIANTEAEEGQR